MPMKNFFYETLLKILLSHFAKSEAKRSTALPYVMLSIDFLQSKIIKYLSWRMRKKYEAHFEQNVCD